MVRVGYWLVDFLSPRYFDVLSFECRVVFSSSHSFRILKILLDRILYQWVFDSLRFRIFR